MLTYSPEHTYRFYLGIDPDDSWYQDSKNQEMIRHYIVASCESVEVIFITLDRVEKGHLTRMWNRLCDQAYQDGCDYFYFCGDDIEWTKQGWINQAIALLSQHDQVGFTGPTNNNGNTNIITQTFVSRKHFDIFGYAYPEEIWNWYCDDWVNLVYGPEYTYRMDAYRCFNQGGVERYAIVEAKELCQHLVNRDRIKLKEYIETKV